MPKKATVQPKPTDPLADGPLPTVEAPRRRLQIRYKNPYTAKLVARAFLRFNGDMPLALKKLRPGFEDVEYATYGNYLERQPEMREAISKELESLGLDDQSFAKFLQKVWERFYIGQQKDRDRATQVLARGFGLGDKAEEGRKPAPLPIRGIEEGLKHMMQGSDSPSDPTATFNPTGFGKMVSASQGDVSENVAAALEDEPDGEEPESE